MCRIDGIETVQFINDAERIAKKFHHCNECGRSIGPGETYRAESFIWEGKFNYHRTCSHCEVGRKWLEKNCGGFIYTEVLAELRDHAEEYKILSLYKLAFSGSKKWRTSRGELMKVPSVPRELRV